MKGEGQWRRVHPLSPVVKFWLTLIICAFIFLRPRINEFFESGLDVSSVADDFGKILHFKSVVALLLFVAFLLLLLGSMFWSWWFTKYLITADTVQVREGFLFRTDKQARLDRVQSIEISQSLVARILRLAELRFEVADGGNSTLYLRYVTLAQAEELRTQLLSRARVLHQAQENRGVAPVSSGPGGADRDPTPAGPDPLPDLDSSVVESAPTPQATSSVEQSNTRLGASGLAQDEREIVRVTPARALLAILLSGGTLVLLAVVPIYLLLTSVLGVFLGLELSLSALIPLVLTVAASTWSRFSTTANFRVVQTPEGLKVRYGLTSTRTQTIPLGRIHAVGVSQPMLWRIPGWFLVRINLAGVGTSGEDHDERRVLLPVGTRNELARVLPFIMEDPEHGGLDEYQVRVALEGTGTEHGFVTSPRQARWLDPLTYRRNGYASTNDMLLFRSGWWTRRVMIVPHARTQSVALEGGPLQYRLGLATVTLHVVGGALSEVSVRHLSLDDAQRLVIKQAACSTHAQRLTRGGVAARGYCSALPQGEQGGSPRPEAADSAASAPSTTSGAS